MDTSARTEAEAPEPADESRSAGGATLICASCGSEEPEGSGFCGSCGAEFAPGDSQSDDPGSAYHSPPSEVVAPAGEDAPTEIAPESEERPPAPPTVPAAPAPVAAAPSGGPRRRPRTAVLVAGLGLLIAAGAAAVLFGTGVIGGSSSGKSDDEFVRQMNENVVGPLGQADQTAAGDAITADGASLRVTDGGRIVQVAGQASAYLSRLTGLSEQQRREVLLLLAFVAANQRYGQAFAAFTLDDGQSQIALEGAAAAARAASASVQSGLPADLRLPSQTAFITLSAPPPTTTTTTTTTTTITTPPAPDVTVVYVRQVDDLLNRSSAVVLALRSFIPRATSDQISRSAAVAAANSYLGQRRLELQQAEELTVPPQFARAQGLLVRALEASVADDQALVAWTVARRDGSGNAQALFNEVNRVGAEATVLKQQFLRVYGQQRQTSTGRSPASLPSVF